eukprot:TRINITY_DN7689_c0_g1_i6.p6 TRINITY_DN7689_c0_g1~~TRINITY_DN7689_c0_g1_i6.p6  ORF type:complete len:130 (-),score=18.52 TRINITY_DN7689_c0_g1_i6:1017-1406(-)
MKSLYSKIKQRRSTANIDGLQKAAGVYSKSRKQLLQRAQEIKQQSIARRSSFKEEKVVQKASQAVLNLVQKGNKQEKRIQKIKHSTTKSAIEEQKEKILLATGKILEAQGRLKKGNQKSGPFNPSDVWR